jgi:hypothetical protein
MTQRDRDIGNWTVEMENEPMETRNAERNKDDSETKGNNHQVRTGDRYKVPCARGTFKIKQSRPSMESLRKKN